MTEYQAFQFFTHKTRLVINALGRDYKEAYRNALLECPPEALALEGGELKDQPTYKRVKITFYAWEIGLKVTVGPYPTFNEAYQEAWSRIPKAKLPLVTDLHLFPAPRKNAKRVRQGQGKVLLLTSGSSNVQ